MKNLLLKIVNGSCLEDGSFSFPWQLYKSLSAKQSRHVKQRSTYSTLFARKLCIYFQLQILFITELKWCWKFSFYVPLILLFCLVIYCYALLVETRKMLDASFAIGRFSWLIWLAVCTYWWFILTVWLYWLFINNMLVKFVVGVN